MKRKGRIFRGAMAMAVMVLAGTTANAEEGGSLNLYMSTWEVKDFEAAISAFQEQYPEVELNIETWDPYSSSIFGEAEKLSARLMAGEGPDLLISQNFPTQDLMKLIKAQVYAPLDEFMAQEDIWNDENYVMSVIDGGKFDGKQYVMPLSYTPFLMISSAEAMQEAHLTAEECPDTLSVMKTIAALYDTDYTERILADFVQLSAFPLCLDGDFLDYAGENIGTDSQILKEACTAYSRMYEEDMTMPDTYGEYSEYGTAIAERRAYCYFTTGTGNVSAAIGAAGGIAAVETPEVLPLRNAQGESLANVHGYAGIRANSENKQNAWNMLRLMLDEEGQRSYSVSNNSYSVLRTVMEDVIEDATEKAFESVSAPVGEPGEAFMEKFRSYACHPQKCVFVSDVVVTEFKNAMEPFYYGEKDYEECIAKFENFARIYLSE